MGSSSYLAHLVEQKIAKIAATRTHYEPNTILQVEEGTAVLKPSMAVPQPQICFQGWQVTIHKVGL